MNLSVVFRGEKHLVNRRTATCVEVYCLIICAVVIDISSSVLDLPSIVVYFDYGSGDTKAFVKMQKCLG